MPKVLPNDQETTASSELRKVVAERIAFLMFYKKLENPDAYFEYSMANEDFDADMNAAYAAQENKAIEGSNTLGGPKATRPLPPYCGHCKQLVHREAGCFKLHPELIPRKPSCRIGCAKCQKEGHLQVDCYQLHPTKIPKVVFRHSCASCGKPHNEKNYWKLHPELAPKSPARSQPRAITGTVISLADYIKPAKVHRK